MVFGFHTWVGGATHHAGGGAAPHERERHHHKLDIPANGTACAFPFPSGAATAGGPLAASPAATLSSTAAATAAAAVSPHVVLNNGHAIKNLASHRGYATSPDGVRLFYEVFESHTLRRSQPAKYSGRGAGAQEPTAPVEVRAIAGSPRNVGQAAVAAAINGATPPGANSSVAEAAAAPHPAGADLPSPRSAAPGSPIVNSPAGAAAASAAAAVTALVSPGVAGEQISAAGAQLPMAESRASRGVRADAAPASLPAPEDSATTFGLHQPRWLSSCAEPEEPEEEGNEAAAELASPGSKAASPAGEALTAETVPRGLKAADGEPEGEVANVLLIMGFAAGRHGWLPLIHHWVQQADTEPLHRLRARFCVFDNRGIGDSDSPPHTRCYSTTIMARDAIAVMDRMGWRRAHVVGFSMGGMVALRLAVAAPERLLSLTALSVTNGGWQAVPTRWRSLKLLLWAAAARTPHQRAHVDVHFHFSKETLHAEIPGGPCGGTGDGDGAPGTVPWPAGHGGSAAAARAQARRVESALIEEYVSTAGECAPQPHAGLMGQLYAVWNHGLSGSEQQRLRQLDVPYKVIHGYHDAMAMPAYGERIAKHTRAAYIALNGGHFVARECAPEVCMHIADSLASARRLT